MGEERIDKDQAKVRKKLAKAAAKGAKKQAKQERGGPTRITSSGDSPASTADSETHTLTPAERSAAAAERNIVIQQRRFMVAIIGAAIALTTLLLTWWNWSRQQPKNERGDSAGPAIATTPEHTEPSVNP